MRGKQSQEEDFGFDNNPIPTVRSGTDLILLQLIIQIYYLINLNQVSPGPGFPGTDRTCQSWTWPSWLVLTSKEIEVQTYPAYPHLPPDLLEVASAVSGPTRPTRRARDGRSGGPLGVDSVGAKPFSRKR